MHKKSTDELLKLISKESRLDTFLKNNAEEFEATSLKDELARLSSLHHTTKADIIRLSLLDKTYTYQILDGKKTNPSRKPSASPSVPRLRRHSASSVWAMQNSCIPGTFGTA